MQFPPLVEARFIRRLNRFAALVDIDRREHLAHIPNSGRLGELLVPGYRVLLAPAPPETARARKTAYDLALVDANGVLASADARLPNKLVAEALAAGALPPFAAYTAIHPEKTYGDSRLDFLLQSHHPQSHPPQSNPRQSDHRQSDHRQSDHRQSDHRQSDHPQSNHPPRSCYLETKSVTLVENGIALFPDAPTIRGVKHLRSLSHAVAAGHAAAVIFVIQRADARAFAPHDTADPLLGAALRSAVAAGVTAHAYRCQVSETAITLANPIPLLL